MNDAFLEYFPWIADVLNNNIADCFKEGTDEYVIIKDMKNNWGTKSTIDLLDGLSGKYGDKAFKAVDKYFEFIIRRDWANIGKSEAHGGSEIDDFIQLLWEPLKPLGFEYSMERNGQDAVFCVTKCPIYELAEKTGMHKWLYHLACATDYYSAASFSSKIDFKRSKTLIDGNECCNHQYYYKK